jgi:glycosyltransferase involved in cell wall biosynthesis
MPATAIITRTKDRPLLLHRAARSVARQKYRDFAWVVVNDGGDRGEVEAALEPARQHEVDLHLVHRRESTGMEAASNAGLAASKSEYIAIHDDDDTWHPAFLERTVSFLESAPLFVGVICHSEEVREEIKGRSIVERSRRPLNSEVHDIHISELFYRNLFPPISLLYRRSALEAIGAYDERLPVLGDWDFNLRLILHGEIAVIEETLAYYHVRKARHQAPNSIHDTPYLHKRYEAVIRNRLIRAALDHGTMHPGSLMALSSFGRVRRGVKKSGAADKSWLPLQRLLKGEP